MSELFHALREAIVREEAVAQATLVRGEPLGAKLLIYEDGRTLGSLGHPELDRAVTADARELLLKGEPETRS